MAKELPEITFEFPTTVFDWLVVFLKDAKAAMARVASANIQGEYMVTKRMVEDSYADMEPGDVPVDVISVTRDLALTRDRAIDEVREDIDRRYRITFNVLRAVADRFPEIYNKACEGEVVPGAADFRSSPSTLAPTISELLPESVLLSLSADTMLSIVDLIQISKDGATLAKILSSLSIEITPAIKLATKAFLNFLVECNHVEVTSGKSGKYKAKKTLKLLRATLVGDSEFGEEL